MSNSTHQQPADPLDLLEEGARTLGVDLASQTREWCRVYLEELCRWNARVNLTGLKSPEEMVRYLFLDALALLAFLGEPSSLLDVGSGAGFPGLVLKLVRPGLALTLVESRGKKAAFLEYLTSLLGLDRVEVLQVRLNLKLAREWGPRYAAVTSRAAFALEQFLKLAAPLLQPGGLALAPKGRELPEPELAAARRALPRLGLGELTLKPYYLPLSGETRLLALARKRR
uniref:Ribosomal RNA small subunit methyltransferase G n=1 Tax=Desulfobacca acetoxidans TaxID=60893 RepID=A0A7V4G9I8_9BACT